MQKIKLKDEVIVIAGKDKGKQGIVNAIIANRCLVDGINMVKKHTKPNPELNVVGGIIDREAPIHISNIAIYNPTSKKADRVGFKLEDGKKIRIFKSTQTPIDQA